jgi:adenine deaminase
MNIAQQIKFSRGEETVDVLFTNARVVDVFGGQIITTPIAIHGEYIAGLGEYAARQVIDLAGRYVAPGFIDAHVHIESAMVNVTEFARAVLPCGTTSVVADPHEIANVLGTQGIEYMLDCAVGQPMNIFYTLPSCVPATHLETAAAHLDAAALRPLIDHERIVALAEMMNFPGVIHRDADVLQKIDTARQHRKPVDGHAPGLSGMDLSAYVAAGISSDHECTTAAEASEKLTLGMHIMVREGTGSKDLVALLPLVNAATARRMMWCTDDRHAHDLLEEGHIDTIVRQAIGSGLDPIIAIQMATLNPAEYFGLAHVGAIAPGRQADLVIFDRLQQPRAERVYCRGRLVAEKGQMVTGIPHPDPVAVAPTMHVKPGPIDFSIPAGSGPARVIEIVPDQLLTRERQMPPTLTGDQAVADPARDMLKIAVVERHRHTGNVGKGFVHGFGLQQGALASSVAHDAHNVIVVGTNDADMQAAVAHLIRLGGGLAAVHHGDIVADVALPIAGLMSTAPIGTVRDQLDHLLAAARRLGAVLQDPFMTLSFLALPVIPSLKLTDQGLVDVDRFAVVPLYVNG